MPLAELERLQSKANDELEGKARIDFLRDLGSGTRQCNLDKAGRLTLPEDFCEQLHLKGDVTLVGVLGIFEIWNVQTWNAGSKKTGSGTKAHFTAFGL